MKIKRILPVFAFLLMTSLAMAQPAPGARRSPFDPGSLTPDQIAQMQSPEALFRLATIYKQQDNNERLSWVLQRLTVLRPNSGELKLALAAAYAAQGQKSKTYDALLGMQRQGFGYDIADNKAFVKVADTRVWTYIVDNLKANLKSFGEGKVAYTLPKGDHLYESLAYDSKRKQFLVGSVRDGTISLLDKDGKLKEFIKPDAANGLWAVYALSIDPDNQALYVASTASVYFKGFSQTDFGKAGVFKFDLASGKLLKKYLLTPDSQPRTLSSIVAGRNGQVFAADGLRNIIYRLDGGELKPLVENPRLTSVRGLALSDDGKTLYFADYSLGIAGVDLAAGKGFEIEYDPKGLVLGGIDGLYWYQHNLVIIQNGMSPHRVMRLALDASGRKIVRATPLDAGNPAFTLPTYGAIDGDGLYFIANSQKNEYDSFGSPKDKSKLEAERIFRSDLQFAWKAQSAGRDPLSPALPVPMSKPGSGVFSNVEGGSQTSD